MPPPSGGVAAPTGERCFPRLTLTPSDPLLLSQGCSQPFGQLRVLLIQAMSLCAADFKPVCRGKIGPLYQPSFIVHALFVNPTNYIYFPIATCFLLSFFSLFSLFCPGKQRDKRRKTTDETAASRRDLWHGCRPQEEHQQEDGSLLRTEITWQENQRSRIPQALTHIHRLGSFTQSGWKRTKIKEVWGISLASL